MPKFLVACSVLLFWLGAAHAQVNTATVEARVVDRDDNGVTGVAVIASNTETGFTAETVTDGDGVARLLAIPPGTYDVTFTVDGRVLLVHRELRLQVGQTAVLRTTNSPQFQQEIIVVGDVPLVDLHKTDSSTNILPEQIQSLPVQDRDFQRLAFIAPSVQRERGEFRFVSGGPVVGAAGNASQSTILVDGVDLTDPALGLSMARFSQDSIREFRLITNRFDSEVGGSAGGAVSIVTRSGTNTLNAVSFAFARDDALRARGALEHVNVPYSRYHVGGAGGGPLVRDRTHIFGSLEQIHEGNIVLFRPSGGFVSQQANISVPIDQTLGFVRVDHQVDTRHRFAGKLAYERFRQDNFRVGGVQDPSYGQQLNRDNRSVNGEHSWVGSAPAVSQLRFEITQRMYDEPRNSTDPAEWFSSGNTLRTGGNVLGDLLGSGTFYELRETLSVLRKSHQIKLGAGLQHVRDRSRIDVYESGLFLYVGDTRALPLAYVFGSGSADIRANTTRYTGYVHDDWLAARTLTVSMGVRYDIDTNGNNPQFRHPLVPDGRKVDKNNLQPRAALSWDVGGTGKNVIRAGAGQFTGRYLLVPLFAELQQNGVSGRVAQTRINGLLLGLPSLALDVANPTATGIPQPPDIGLMDQTLNAPYTRQVSAGWTRQVFDSRVYVEAEGVWARGRDEIIIRDKNFAGNSTPTRLNPSYSQINTYTNEGRSTYKALTLSLNGTLPGGHVLASHYTLASKRNIADDFSPEFPFGYPSDPADIEAEFGRSRSDERHRAVLSGVLNAPYRLTIGAIYEFGSGQPWTHRLGYDFNGDGKNSDRPSGVKRFGENGPHFSQLSLRVSRRLSVGRSSIDVIGEVFNLFNTTNFDVTSIDAAEFLSGPTLTAPALPRVSNPQFRTYRATLPSREVQIGIRWTL